MKEQVWKTSASEIDAVRLYPEPEPEGGWPVWLLYGEQDRGEVYDRLNLSPEGGAAALSHQGFQIVPFGSAFIVLADDGGVAEPEAVASTLPGAVAVVSRMVSEKQAAGWRLAPGGWVPPEGSDG